MRLFHKLFLLFSLTAMVSALAIAGVLTWNLKRGFVEYLNARDAEMLVGFATDFESYLNSPNAPRDSLPTRQRLEQAVAEMERDGRLPELPPHLKRSPPPAAETEPGIAKRGPDMKGPPPDGFGPRLRGVRRQ